MHGSRGSVSSMGYTRLAGSPRENTRTNLFCIWSTKTECGADRTQGDRKGRPYHDM